MKDQSKKNTESSQSERLLAAMSYIWFLFIIPLAIRRDNEYIQHHVRQGMVLFVFEIVAILLGTIPLLGTFVVGPLGIIFAVLLAILGIRNAMLGVVWDMPLLGKFVKKE